MIVVHINPAGIQNIYFESDSELTEDLCLGVWPLVRDELNRLHRRMRKAAHNTLSIAGRELSMNIPDSGIARRTPKTRNGWRMNPRGAQDE